MYFLSDFNFSFYRYFFLYLINWFESCNVQLRELSMSSKRPLRHQASAFCHIFNFRSKIKIQFNKICVLLITFKFSYVNFNTYLKLKSRLLYYLTIYSISVQFWQLKCNYLVCYIQFRKIINQEIKIDNISYDYLNSHISNRV